MKRQSLGKVFAAALLVTPLGAQDAPGIGELRADRARLITIVQDLEITLRETLDGYQGLQNEFADLKKDHAGSMPADQAAKLRKELDRTAARLSDLQANHKNGDASRAAAGREQELLHTDLKNLRRELHAERDQLVTARAEVEKLRGLEEAVVILKKGAAESIQSNARLRTEIESLKSAGPMVEEKARVALADLEKEKKVREANENLVRALETEKKAFMTQAAELQKGLTEKTAALKVFDATLSDLKTARADLETMKADLKAANDNLARREEELAATRKEMGQLHLQSRMVEKQLVGLKVRLAEIAPVSYGLGEAGVEGQQERVLADVKECLAMFPSARFEVVGHTCDLGEKEDNQLLSEKRAQSLAFFLVENGVPEDLIKARGEGANHPLLPNISDENRKKNRRVEIQILD